MLYSLGERTRLMFSDFFKFAELCLNDDDGISEEAFNFLVEAAERHKMVQLREICRTCNATDGRFYLKGD